MDLAEAHELSMLQAGNEAQNPRLLGEFQMILKPDQIVTIGTQILLAKLDDGVGPTSGSRIVEAHGFHRAEAQRVAAAARQLFDRQTCLEIGSAILFNVSSHALARQ